MRNLTGPLVVVLLAVTVFYWVAKLVLKSPPLSGYAGWAMVILAAATLVLAFLREREEKKSGRKGE